MLILGLDPALHLGWAWGPKIGALHSGVWRLPGFDDRHANTSLAQAYSAVRCIVSENGIEGVVIEAPMRGIKRKNKRGFSSPVSAHGELMLTMLSGVLRAGAINGGAKWIITPQPNQWRAQVLGNGYPQDPKQAALDYGQLFGWNITEHDAAEAGCMVVYGHGNAVGR